MTPGPKDRSGSTDLRQRLLDAAREILREPDTPLELRKVAERAGKSRTAPYLVFGKESEGGGLLALRIAVAAQGAREMNALMEDAALGVDDPIEALRRVALAFLDFVADNGRLFRLMYGPEISAVQRVGEDGFRDHPECRALLDFRSRAGWVVSELIHRGQERGLLRPEPYDEGFDHGRFLETPRARYLQIAWATMIGIALLRDDQLLQAVGWRITPAQGARLIVESVFGLDPERVGGAAASFLASNAAPSFLASEAAPSPLIRTQRESAAGFGEDRDDDRYDADLDDDRADERYDADLDDDREDAPADENDAAPDAVPDDHLRALSVHEESFDISGESFDISREEPLGILRDDRLSEIQFMSAAPAPDLEARPNLTEALNKNSGLRRAAFSDKIRNRARILWIDDHPDRIEHEVDTLRQLGATVTVVRNTHGATRALQAATADGGEEARPFQVILSDIARGSRRDAGVRALPELRRLAPDVPVVFFVGDYDASLGVPPGASGITNRMDELLHLVVDALEGR